jgi:hypothetical protein
MMQLQALYDILSQLFPVMAEAFSHPHHAPAYSRTPQERAKLILEALISNS